MNAFPEKAERVKGQLCDLSGLEREGGLWVAEAMHEQSAPRQHQGDGAIGT